MDFSRYTPVQIRAHCRNNARSLAINQAAYQAQRQASLARAERLRAQVDDEVRAFRAWRATVLVPLRSLEGSPESTLEKRLPHAAQELFRLRVTWGALSPLLTAEERAHILGEDLRQDPLSAE